MSSCCFDSVTQVPETSRGRAVLAASHGGLYVANAVLCRRLGGIIFSDAGVGRERAGIGGLAVLDAHLVPAAAVSAHSARIGDGLDCLNRGVISFANETARRMGVARDMVAREALALMSRQEREPVGTVAPLQENRRTLPGVPGIGIVIVDSNSLVGPDDRAAVVVTGSHGGLLGGRPETAIKQPVAAAIYNDASGGIDGAGMSRLAALDARFIAGATVSAWSARIGDGQSTLDDGYVTRVNECAARAGGEIGISCRELVARVLDAASRRFSAGG